MNIQGIVHAALASYLAATLCATALAKLRNWHVSATGLIREGVVPNAGIRTILLTVCVSEFSLATLLAFGIEVAVAGFASAALFVIFAGYRLVVAKRTKSVMCSCAGEHRSDPATPPIVIGSVVACLIQAAFGCALALNSESLGYPLALLPIAAWAIPIVILAACMRRRSETADHNARFTSDFFHLGSADLRIRP